MWRPGCGLYKTMAVFERTRTAEVTPARTRTRKLQHYDDCERRSRFAARSMSGAFVGFSTMAECRPGHCLHAANPLLERGCGSGRYWARTSDPQLVETWWAFTPVRARSLGGHGSWDGATAYRTSPNPNERHVFPLFPQTPRVLARHATQRVRPDENTSGESTCRTCRKFRAARPRRVPIYLYPATK